MYGHLKPQASEDLTEANAYRVCGTKAGNQASVPQAPIYIPPLFDWSQPSPEY